MPSSGKFLATVDPRDLEYTPFRRAPLGQISGRRDLPKAVNLLV